MPVKFITFRSANHKFTPHLEVNWHVQVQNRLQPGADRSAGEGIPQGKLHLQAQEVRAGKRAKSAGKHY